MYYYRRQKGVWPRGGKSVTVSMLTCREEDPGDTALPEAQQLDDVVEVG